MARKGGVYAARFLLPAVLMFCAGLRGSAPKVECPVAPKHLRHSPQTDVYWI